MIDPSQRAQPIGDELSVRQHRRAAFRVARSILGDSDLAEDVAQDVMVRLTAALPGFENTTELDGWVYRVTTNRCRDHLRSRKRRFGDIRVAESQHPNLVSESDPGQSLDSERARAAVTAALARLPDDQREVLVLRYVEGRSYSEIAELRSTPEGTVASQLFRALKKLGRDIDSIHLEVLK